MARPKRPPSPMFQVARDYLSAHVPELKDAPLHLHFLDGPPGAPRYAVNAVVCNHIADCPYHVDPLLAENERCPVFNCELRESLRLLISREGEVVKVMHSGVKWD